MCVCPRRATKPGHSHNSGFEPDSEDSGTESSHESMPRLVESSSDESGHESMPRLMDSSEESSSDDETIEAILRTRATAHAGYHRSPSLTCATTITREGMRRRAVQRIQEGDPAPRDPSVRSDTCSLSSASFGFDQTPLWFNSTVNEKTNAKNRMFYARQASKNHMFHARLGFAPVITDEE